MTKIASLIIAGLLVFTSLYAASKQETYGLHITNGDLQVVLGEFAKISGLELEITPEVEKLHTPINLHAKENVTMTEMIRLIEQAMKEQAGVIIQKQSGKKALATLKK